MTMRKSEWRLSEGQRHKVSEDQQVVTSVPNDQRFQQS